MPLDPHRPVPPSRQRQLSAGSAVLLAFWTVSAGAAFALSMIDTWRVWSGLFLAGSMLFTLALCFSLQWDLVRHYAPQVGAEKWTFHSVSGLVLGVVAGAIVGNGGVAAVFWLSGAIGSYQMSGFLLPAAVASAVLLGFAILGTGQALVLKPHIRGAWWWLGAMAIAWVPVLLVWLGYEAVLQSMAINIYSEQHGTVKVLAAEVALLCPSLGVFARIVRRTRAASIASTIQAPQPRNHATGVLTILLVLPLLVVLAFAALFVGQRLRVERVWFAGGPAGYLSVAADGSVVTSPPAGEMWRPDLKLRDSSPGGSMQVGVNDLQVVISTTNGATIGIFEVFTEAPPEDYPGEVINVVRFSPDGALLAAGTGQVMEDDSSLSASNDHAVHVWSVPDGSKRYTLLEPQYSVRAVAWSPDGQYLAAGGGLENRSGMFKSDNVIRVWRLATRQDGESAPPALAFTFTGHPTTVEALAWSTDGKRLASRDLSGRVVAWNIP